MRNGREIKREIEIKRDTERDRGNAREICVSVSVCVVCVLEREREIEWMDGRWAAREMNFLFFLFLLLSST